MFCLAWMGRCALCVLQVVSLEHRLVLCGRIARWRHMVAILWCRWYRVEILCMSKSCKYNNLCILNMLWPMCYCKHWICNLVYTMIYCTLCSFNSVAMIQLPFNFAPAHAILVCCFVFMALLWCLALHTWMQASCSMSMEIILAWNLNVIWGFCSIFDFIVRIRSGG